MSAELTSVRPLNLVDLRGDKPVKMGVPTDSFRASSHRVGQKWSLAFWLHNQRPHGILYPSRLNEEINLVLYDVALPECARISNAALPRVYGRGGRADPRV